MLREAWQPEWATWVTPATVNAFREQYLPELPPLRFGDYLIGYLWELGPVVSEGKEAVSFAEMESWERKTGVSLNVWEARLIRRLSMAYLAESYAAQKRDAEPPWSAAGAKPDVSDAQRAIRALANL